MTSSVREPGSYHILLVGIDDYAQRPLGGCVNDIDAVQKILLERVGVPKERILRLASPRRGATCAAEVPAEPATLGNLRNAFAALATRAEAGERVFIYYSGHGTRVELERPDGHRFHREALVPVDADQGSGEALLYDHELNRLLGDITARTRAVTLVLDCCHSAGVTRELQPELRPGLTARVLDARKDLGLRAPLRDNAPREARGDGVARTVDACQVVSACLNHELAWEGLGDDGRPHGLLTRAFVRALENTPQGELTSVPWSRIWQAMRGDVERESSQQHLWMGGHAGRAVLAGPPVDGDPGFPVRRVGDTYELAAGTLASVTKTALVAVYDEQPAHFPAIDSDADRKARLGVVRVTNARPSSATAKAEGEPFPTPPGARGRIVAPGEVARLRCAVVPETPALAQRLAGSPLLELVEPARAQARLEYDDGRWVLTDDVHGTRRGHELCALGADQFDRARPVLEHYFSYALPLRMAESAIDLPNALQLTVLACPEALSPEAAETADLAEAPSTAGTSAYDLTDGDRICFRVRNGARESLRVTLVNSAASGKVQILDEQSIDAGHTHTFWAGNTIGATFEMNVPAGKRGGIDRLIAIGTTANKDVRHLSLDRSFAEILATPRDIGASQKPPAPAEQWTATQVIVRTHARR